MTTQRPMGDRRGEIQQSASDGVGGTVVGAVVMIKMTVSAGRDNNKRRFVTRGISG